MQVIKVSAARSYNSGVKRRKKVPKKVPDHVAPSKKVPDHVASYLALRVRCFAVTLEIISIAAVHAGVRTLSS